MKTMHDLHAGLKALGKNDLILDVRSPEEFAEGHIAGARNIPHDEVSVHAEELRKYDRVIIHCMRGGRAGMAFQALQQAGLKNLVCIGSSGMGDWLAAGYPVTRD